MPETPRDFRKYLRGPVRAAIVVSALILACWFVVLLHSSSPGLPSLILPFAWIMLFLALYSALFVASDWPYRVGLLGVLAVGVIFFDDLIRPLGPTALRAGFWPMAMGLAAIWMAGRLRGGKWLTAALPTVFFLASGFVCLTIGKGVGSGSAGLFAPNCAAVISHGLDLATNDNFLQALVALGVVGWLAGQNTAGAPTGQAPWPRVRCLALAAVMISAAAALFLYTNFQALIFAFLIVALALHALVTARRLTAMLIAAFGGAMVFHAALGLADGSGVSPGYEILLLAAFVAAVSERPHPWPSPRREPSC